jgi:glycosyltransferase involved in cell wall biosynthesis
METIAWRLGRCLADQGHDVTFFGGKSKRTLPSAAQGLTVKTFDHKNRDQFPNWGSRFRKLMERLSFARNAIPSLRQGNFDRILVFKPYDLAPVLWALRGSKAKVGYHSGGTEFYPGFAFLGRKLDYLGAVSAFNASQIEKASGLKVRVDYPGVDSDSFRPVAPDPEMMKRFGIEESDQVLVSAVRLVPLKGIQYAIEAMAALRQKWPNLKMVVAGEGPYRLDLENKARELGLGDRVHMAGFMDPGDLPAFYALGDIAVFPSHGEEALGLSIAEAMACELPVVASRLGGVPEVVDESTGILTRPKDVSALTNALKTLLEHPKKAREMGVKARELVKRRFDWDNFAQSIEKAMKG